MPFIDNVDLLTLSRKIRDIVFPSSRATEKLSLELHQLPGTSKSAFKFYLCTKEHCILFVDLFTNISLMEVLQTDAEDVREKLGSILNGNTDLIPNQYEGGFKVWEGLHDLIAYIGKHDDILAKMMNNNNQTDGQNQVINILDLGCGSGLLSIYIAAQLRAKFPTAQFHIYLQDYNDNVMKYFTIPNVILNDILLPLTAPKQKSNSDEQQEEQLFSELVTSVQSSYHFMYGDWKQIGEELTSKGVKFDLIVSAETLYSEANYEKLYNVFRALLRSPTGQVLIATKSHYFGVGGGTWSFLDYVAEQKEKLNNKRPKFNNNNDEPSADKSDATVEIVSDPRERKLQLEAEIVHEIETNLLRHIISLNWT